jgi:hypothetical protein
VSRLSCYGQTGHVGVDYSISRGISVFSA